MRCRKVASLYIVYWTIRPYKYKIMQLLSQRVKNVIWDFNTKTRLLFIRQHLKMHIIVFNILYNLCRFTYSQELFYYISICLRLQFQQEQNIQRLRTAETHLYKVTGQFSSCWGFMHMCLNFSLRNTVLLLSVCVCMYVCKHIQWDGAARIFHSAREQCLILLSKKRFYGIFPFESLSLRTVDALCDGTMELSRTHICTRAYFF